VGYQPFCIAQRPGAIPFFRTMTASAGSRVTAKILSQLSAGAVTGGHLSS
jgi:hypothetical protein